jgi:serine/threonine protein phosphatase PrpC
VTSFPDVKKVPIKPDHDFIIIACDGIWDCFTNDQAIKFVRRKRESGPKNGSTSPTKTTKKTGLGVSRQSSSSTSSPTKTSKSKDGIKKTKVKGETSYIIEDLMNQGIAKGDITMSDGTGTDNMTCIIVFFRDPEEVKLEKEQSTVSTKEESKNSS